MLSPGQWTTFLLSIIIIFIRGLLLSFLICLRHMHIFNMHNFSLRQYAHIFKKKAKKKTRKFLILRTLTKRRIFFILHFLNTLTTQLFTNSICSKELNFKIMLRNFTLFYVILRKVTWGYCDK